MTTTPPAIAAQSLTFTYRGGAAPSVRDMSFEIARGEIFGLLGPSGAGKSTAQKVLIGVNRGYAGSASVLGTEIKARRKDFYERIGVGFELPNHYGRLTGRENLTFFARLYAKGPRDVMPLLAMMGLADDADKPVMRYSKGMKMRLSFARALLHDPEVLFLDEPTSGLDPTNAQKMRDIIKTKRDAGKTIFLTTHNMHDAEALCDRVAFVVDGTIRALDTPDALKRQHGERQVRVVYDDGAEGVVAAYPLDRLGHNPDFLADLRQRAIRTIHSQEATLDQVFIKTTGVALDSAQDAPA